MPATAQQRLATLRGQAGAPALFTSDLSVGEFFLLREAGYEALGLVMGSSVYHVGLQAARFFENQELTVLSQALYHARELAMDRMEAEATALGASGVVGVRLTVARQAWGQDLAEFVAVGTAVRPTRPSAAPGAYHRPDGKPFTSDLSGQDFWTLLRAGYAPAALVMGNCVYHVAHQRLGQWLRQVGRNAEMPNYTQALYDARELALARMQAEAVAAGAQGIVGVRVEEAGHGWGEHVMEFLAIGTAVAPLAGAGTAPGPALVVPLDG